MHVFIIEATARRSKAQVLPWTYKQTSFLPEPQEL